MHYCIWHIEAEVTVKYGGLEVTHLMLKATVSIEVVFKALVDICVQGKETRAIDVLHSRELP